MESRYSRDDYLRDVRIYHWFPSLMAASVVAIFLAVFLLTTNYVLSAAAAGAPAVVLAWRWSVAAKQVDKWACPKCGSHFPKKISWSYPPEKCPQCGERVI